ncbi:MAG: serine protease [Rickettsiales bacterium]|nr:serine protease [Rickettsiales bacterium]
MRLILVFFLVLTAKLSHAFPPIQKRAVKNVTISGIGAYVNNYDILTSYSAVSGCKSLNILTSDGKIADAELLGALEISKGNLAFLRTNHKSAHYIVVGSFSLKKDDTVSILDLREDLKGYLSVSGTVAFIGDDKHDIEFISDDAKKGNSGSPLYNSKGYIIGVLKGIATSSSEGRYVTATSIKTIRDFAIKKRIRLSRAQFYGDNQTEKHQFYDNYGVNVSCFSKDENGKLQTVGKFGTGSFINPNDVMTNAHVVDNCDVINITTKDKVYQGQLIAQLPEKQGDIAFIRTKANTNRFSYYDDRLPLVGQEIFFPFYTEDRGIFKKSIGRISYVGHKNHGLEINAPDLKRVIAGAPVFDKQGRLIGTLATKLNYDMQKTLLIATPASNIVDFATNSRVRILSNRVARYNGTHNNDQALTKIICNK